MREGTVEDPQLQTASADISATAELDLRDQACPINFVKTKLRLEEMAAGEILEVILDEGEPIQSVPRSVKEEGHRIIKVERLNEAFCVRIEKC